MTTKTEIASKRELSRRLGWKWGTFQARSADPSWPVPRKPPWPGWVVETLTAWADLRFPKPDEDNSDPTAEGPVSPMLERWREERWKMARLERREREGQLIPREIVHGVVSQCANRARAFADALTRQYGNEASDQWNDLLDDLKRISETVIRQTAEKGDSDDDDEEKAGSEGEGEQGGDESNPPVGSDVRPAGKRTASRGKDRGPDAGSVGPRARGG